MTGEAPHRGMAGMRVPFSSTKCPPALRTQQWCRDIKACRAVVGLSLPFWLSAFFRGENSSSRRTSYTTNFLGEHSMGGAGLETVAASPARVAVLGPQPSPSPHPRAAFTAMQEGGEGLACRVSRCSSGTGAGLSPARSRQHPSLQLPCDPDPRALPVDTPWHNSRGSQSCPRESQQPAWTPQRAKDILGKLEDVEDKLLHLNPVGLFRSD